MELLSHRGQRPGIGRGCLVTHNATLTSAHFTAVKKPGPCNVRGTVMAWPHSARLGPSCAGSLKFPGKYKPGLCSSHAVPLTLLCRAQGTVPPSPPDPASQSPVTAPAQPHRLRIPQNPLLNPTPSSWLKDKVHGARPVDTEGDTWSQTQDVDTAGLAGRCRRRGT